MKDVTKDKSVSQFVNHQGNKKGGDPHRDSTERNGKIVDTAILSSTDKNGDQPKERMNGNRKPPKTKINTVRLWHDTFDINGEVKE